MMKVEPHLIVVKGRATSASGPQPTAPPATPPALDGVVVLISRENRQAGRLDPQTLEEAKRLLAEMKDALGCKAEDDLAVVHRLKPRCLVRLR